MNKQQLFDVLECAKIVWHPLGKCQACYGTTYLEGVYVDVLKSYSTIVAVAVLCHNVDIIVLEKAYYTPTTSHHLEKWMRELQKRGYRVIRFRLDVWSGNKWTKELNRYLDILDYRPFIEKVLDAGVAMKKYKFILFYNNEQFEHETIDTNIVTAMQTFWGVYAKRYTPKEMLKAREFGTVYYTVENYTKYYTEECKQ